MLSGGLILALYPLNGVVEAVPRMSSFDHRWYWTPRSGYRQGTEMREAVILVMALWLTPEERAWRRLWRWQKKATDSEHIRLEKPEGTDTVTTNFPHAFNGIFAFGSGGSPGYGGWPLNNIIPFIIIFDLIWFSSRNLAHESLLEIRFLYLKFSLT